MPQNRADRVFTVGRVVFGATMAAFGLHNVVFADGVFGLEPVPQWIPARQLWAYGTGAVLLGSGAGLMFNQHARLAAGAAGTVLGIWVLALQLPRLLVAPHNGGIWTTTFETVALCGAAWVVTGSDDGAELRRAAAQRHASRMTRVARLAYAGSLPVFGVLHFVYRPYVASVIPVWIPNPDAWAMVTGLALIAAGVGIATVRWRRSAALMLGAMFGTWVLILHLPRALAAPRSRPEWTSLIIALAMAGGAWVIAGQESQRVSRAGERLS